MVLSDENPPEKWRWGSQWVWGGVGMQGRGGLIGWMDEGWDKESSMILRELGKGSTSENIEVGDRAP